MKFPDYDFPSQFLDLGKFRMHYVDQGPNDKPPLVMVHGNPTWSFYFRHLITALSKDYRVIAMDHLGMGLSDKPADDQYSYTFKQHADDVGKLLEHLKIDREITLMLHDWGGMIGMDYATEHPDRIRRLVFFNTAAFHLPPEKTLPWEIGLCRNKLFGSLLVRGFNAFVRGSIKKCVVRRPLSREVQQAYLAPYNNWKNRRAVHRFVQDIPLLPTDRGYNRITNIEEKLHQLANLPTLICWGMKDFVFDHHFLNRWIEIFRNAEVHRFDDAGHFILEDARDEITPIVKKFLKDNPV